MAQAHEVLGVAANADEATINAAFRRAAKKFHPDLNNGDQSGLRRLRRLIAARDFLTGRKWRPSGEPKMRLQLPAFRKKRIRRSVVLSFVLTGACGFLFLPALVSDTDANQTTVSVVKKTSLFRTDARARLDARVPGARPAEVKAARDLHEAPAHSHTEAAARPLAQSGARRPASSPVVGLKKAVKSAAILMSKTFQRIASEL